MNETQMKTTRILPVPKIAILYPLMITSFICSWMPEQNELTTILFFTVLTCNLLALSIDLSSFKSFLLAILIFLLGLMLFFAHDFYLFFVKEISSTHPKTQQAIAAFIVCAIIAPLMSMELTVFYLAIGSFFLTFYVVAFALQIQMNIFASSHLFYSVSVILAFVILTATIYNFACNSWILSWNWNRYKIRSANIFGKTVTYEGKDLEISHEKYCVLKHLLLRTRKVRLYIHSQDKNIHLDHAYLNKRYVD